MVARWCCVGNAFFDATRYGRNYLGYDIVYNLVNGNPVIYPLLVVLLFLIYIAGYYFFYYEITKRHHINVEPDKHERECTRV